VNSEHSHFFDQQRCRPSSIDKVAGIVELLDLQQPERFDHPYSLLLVVMYALSLGGYLLRFFTLFPLGVARETPGRTEKVFRGASPRLDFADAAALWKE
jgi:hypothetical protein